MLIQLNPKVQYILTILGIGFISALVFLFNKISDGLASQCLKEAPDAFLGQTQCVQAVTIEPWRIMHLLGVLSVIALPCIVYIIAARKRTTV